MTQEAQRIIDDLRGLASVHRRDAARLPVAYAANEAELDAYVVDQYARMSVRVRKAFVDLGARGGEVPEVKRGADVAACADALEALLIGLEE